MAKLVSMKQLLEAGVHFGHQTRRWNPKWINTSSQKEIIYIIDFTKTVKKVDEDNAKSALIKVEKNVIRSTKNKHKMLLKKKLKKWSIPHQSPLKLGGT